MPKDALSKDVGGGPVVGADVYTPAVGAAAPARRRKVQKTKIYVPSVQDVPAGYRPRRGPRGGIYYDPAQDRAEAEHQKPLEYAPRLLPSKEEGIRKPELSERYATFKIRGGKTKVYVPSEDAEEGKHDVTQILAKMPTRARLHLRQVVPHMLWKAGYIGHEHAYIRYKPSLMTVSNQLLDLPDESRNRLLLHTLGHFVADWLRDEDPKVIFHAKQVWEKWSSVEKAFDDISIRYSLIGSELIPGGIGTLLKGYAPRSDLASRSFDEYFAECYVQFILRPNEVPERMNTVFELFESRLGEKNGRKRS